jgi:hypothetical protein
LQKVLVPFSELWKRVMFCSPEVTLKRSVGTPTQVTKLAPWGRLHIEQWQCPHHDVGNSISNFTSPQKQLPVTDEEVIDHLPKSCLFRVVLAGGFTPIESDRLGIKFYFAGRFCALEFEICQNHKVRVADCHR